MYVCMSVCLFILCSIEYSNAHMYTYTYVHVNSEYNSLVFGQLLYKQINNANLNLNTYILSCMVRTYVCVYIHPNSIVFYVQNYIIAVLDNSFIS